jgi:predicted RNA-binding Zn-ribbon protein involved in translation (DUF1610 family)
MTEGKLYCTSCNYQFVPKTGKVPDSCPYCEKKGGIEKTKQVQDLINEVVDDNAEIAKRHV